jgi:hypothetical protein
MGQSQNLQFKATVPRWLAADLPAAGWQTGEIENWRDSGWSVDCTRGASRVEISLAAIDAVGEREWMLQIAPERTPGAISRLFGGKPTATSQDVYELEVAVHQVLHHAQFLENPRWAWDGYPDDSPSTPEPRPAVV